MKEEQKSVYEVFLKSIHNNALDNVDIKLSDIEMLNPLVLAYIGDAVYGLFVRTLLILKGITQVSKLHRESVNYVKAKSQAEILAEITDELTESEKDIVRRGRNTKSATVPKNAEVIDYRMATGFEALIGHLYLTGNILRLIQILEIIEQKKHTDEWK